MRFGTDSISHCVDMGDGVELHPRTLLVDYSGVLCWEILCNTWSWSTTTLPHGMAMRCSLMFFSLAHVFTRLRNHTKSTLPQCIFCRQMCERLGEMPRFVWFSSNLDIEGLDDYIFNQLGRAQHCVLCDARANGHGSIEETCLHISFTVALRQCTKLRSMQCSEER